MLPDACVRAPLRLSPPPRASCQKRGPGTHRHTCSSMSSVSANVPATTAVRPGATATRVAKDALRPGAAGGRGTRTGYCMTPPEVLQGAVVGARPMAPPLHAPNENTSPSATHVWEGRALVSTFGCGSNGRAQARRRGLEGWGPGQAGRTCNHRSVGCAHGDMGNEAPREQPRHLCWHRAVQAASGGAAWVSQDGVPGEALDGAGAPREQHTLCERPVAAHQSHRVTPQRDRVQGNRVASQRAHTHRGSCNLNTADNNVALRRRPKRQKRRRKC
jgi:hypothetical protein